MQWRILIAWAPTGSNCYDQSALGRPDGECYNIGFLDVCNQPYAELGEGCPCQSRTHVPGGRRPVEPFREAPEYLPAVSM